jgi:hypothetical protein
VWTSAGLLLQLLLKFVSALPTQCGMLACMSSWYDTTMLSPCSACGLHVQLFVFRAAFTCVQDAAGHDCCSGGRARHLILRQLPAGGALRQQEHHRTGPWLRRQVLQIALPSAGCTAHDSAAAVMLGFHQQANPRDAACSGALVLASEVVLRMGANPSEKDEGLLYGTCAGVSACRLPAPHDACPASSGSARLRRASCCQPRTHCARRPGPAGDGVSGLAAHPALALHRGRRRAR